MKQVNSKIKKGYSHAGAGFSLVEVLVGTALFLTISIAAYGAYIGLFKLIDLSQYRVLATSLANEQIELARNMPYDDVGVVGSIPSGVIPHTQNIERGGVDFVVETIVRNVDLSFDGTIGGSPNDLSPADNKLLQVTVACEGDCRGLQPIVVSGQVAPKNLETASSNGALFIRVFDANGLPVQGANVHVQNIATSSTISINDVTDANGMLQLIDVPPQGNAYRITVSKSGYSSDRTYPVGGSGNPNPVIPDATVLLQQVTQVSFAIDRLGTLELSSVSPTCSLVPNFDVGLVGSKLIGADVNKYVDSHTTDSNGELVLEDMEWDTYTSWPIDTSYHLVGINPLNPAPLNPGATQNIQLIVEPKDPRTILVTVKDSATGLPISDAEVTLSRTGYEEILTTGKGYVNQTDWSGGSGQEIYTDTSRYYTDDGNIDVDGIEGEIRLRNAFGSYNPQGQLESSVFDTGSESNFFNFTWSPLDPPLLAGEESVRFQIATNATMTPTTTWEYVGPDGTVSSFFDTPDTPIHESHNGHKFLRYLAYLKTADDAVTPNISDVAFTYTSLCTPPGQVAFSGLSSGTYTLTVSKDEYTTYVDEDVEVDSDWQEVTVIMSP